ncbi:MULTISPECIES: hypothetical protein [Alcaligenes]|uniref:hypothetical protein n=1 Tax=Alcaligenes TaxID=507 RepID=UPI002150649A|nr:MULTISPECIES: hypothetical protein [Alcaligenes]MCR4145215.1 hypothetical protein [Alcaligenes faecalis]
MHRIIHTGPIRALTSSGSPLATHCPRERAFPGRRPAIAWRINTASRKPEIRWIADSDKPPSARVWRCTLPSH